MVLPSLRHQAKQVVAAHSHLHTMGLWVDTLRLATLSPEDLRSRIHAVAWHCAVRPPATQNGVGTTTRESEEPTVEERRRQEEASAEMATPETSGCGCLRRSYRVYAPTISSKHQHRAHKYLRDLCSSCCEVVWFHAARELAT